MLDPSQVTEPVTVRPYIGTTGLGGVGYDDPVHTLCQLEASRTVVRGASGEEVVSETTIRLSPDTDLALDLEALFPPESQVTVHGRTSVVITASPMIDNGELVYLEVALT